MDRSNLPESWAGRMRRQRAERAAANRKANQVVKKLRQEQADEMAGVVESGVDRGSKDMEE